MRHQCDTFPPVRATKRPGVSTLDGVHPLSVCLVLAAVLAVSCSSGPRPAGPGQAARRPPAPASPLTTPASAAGPYVAVGASDAVGYGADNPAADAWPRVLARRALPPGTELVNLGVPGATVADAVARQLPEALRRQPALVTVWMNVNDILAQVPPATYERQLGHLVGELRRGGRTRVLVGNTPPLDRLPVYLACQARPDCASFGLPAPAAVRAVVDAYNAAVARVVQATGAELVDLHAVGVEARAAGTEASLVGADGFHPSSAGHRAVADAFAAVLAGGPPAPAPAPAEGAHTTTTTAR